MSDQVKISSIDALEAFRADLIQYIAKARVALEDMEGDVRRTQTWLDTDRTQYWGGQMKLWTKNLHQAEQELYSANLTSPHSANLNSGASVQRRKPSSAAAPCRLALSAQKCSGKNSASAMPDTR